MMKKHLLYILLFTLALGACKKDTTEPVIGNVDDRLSATLTEYQTKLTGAEFGWRGFLLTDSKVVATFLFSFTDKNRTTMSADFKPTPAESSYRLKALQRPTLLFDSYSTLHLLADPTPSVLGGTTGSGYFADFEFAFLSSSADTIKLEGTFNKSKLILVRSKSAAENSDALTSPEAMATTLSKLRTYFKRTTIGGANCEVRIDVGQNIIGFNYLDAGVMKTVSSSYYVSGTTINLFTPLTVGTATVSELNGVNFNTGTGFISASIKGGEAIEIKEAIAPIQYDKTAAQRWFNAPSNGVYWTCFNGFTVDGVTDAYGIKTIPGFNFLIFYAKFNVAYSRLGFIVGGAYGAYGPAPIAAFPADGTIKFTNAGSFGTAPVAIRNIVTNTQNNFFKASGFYVIQSGEKSYDLVALDDARSWISFE